MTKSVGLWIVTLGLGLGQLAQADDVALNAQTGENFILESEANPQGRVLILKDQDERFREELTIFEAPVPGARFEIELNGQDELVYLAQASGIWTVSAFRRDATGTRWVRVPGSRSAIGMGDASGLTALPDGNVAVRVRASSNQENTIRILNPAEGFVQLDAVSETRIAESMAARESRIAAGVIEVTEERRDDEEPKYDTGNGMGFGAGLQAGIGIAYRRHFASRWGVQVAGIAWGDADNLKGILGATLMRTLSKAQSARFYALAGASAFYSSHRTYEYVCPAPSDPIGPCQEIDRGVRGNVTLNFGVGIGMEFTIAKRLGLSLELPITLQFERGEGFKGVYPVPNAALIYYFF